MAWVPCPAPSQAWQRVAGSIGRRKVGGAEVRPCPPPAPSDPVLGPYEVEPQMEAREIVSSVRREQPVVTIEFNHNVVWVELVHGVEEVGHLAPAEAHGTRGEGIGPVLRSSSGYGRRVVLRCVVDHD